MHLFFRPVRLSATLFICLFLACQTPPAGPWTDFTRCATNACVKEAVAVKDAFLKDPKTLLTQMDETYRKGDDHVIGWLYIMRDSVLFSDKYGKTEARFSMQQSMINAAKPFESDPKLGEVAKSITGELEVLAIASELEDNVAEPVAITGVYGFEMPNSAGSGDLKVSTTDAEHLRFALQVLAGGPAHNQGSMEGVAMLSAPGVYEYKTTEYGGTCRLQFTFDGEKATIKTAEGDDATCGFGHNVRADGTYNRSGYDDPFLSAADAKKVKNMQGNWVSTTDAKSEISIDKGMYTDTYGGEQQSKFPYQYYAVCPKDCNPVGKTPCIQVTGQDVMCYTVVKADGKNLELSLVGGTGNTLVFKRK